MSDISDTVRTFFVQGRKIKTTPSGWISGNAPCCVHNGTTPDTRGRGGINIQADGSVSYSCFNCGYKTGWMPGKHISFKFKKLLEWLNVPSSTINKLMLDALKYQSNSSNTSKQLLPTFEQEILPPESHRLATCTRNNKYITKLAQYMQARRLYLSDFEFYYSTVPVMRNRLIIPFYYNNILVGYTARAIEDIAPKYLTKTQPGYVFNLDNQTREREIVIVVEGPIDAIHIEGVALLGSSISEQQAMLINQLNKDVILVPDKDLAGKKLVESALDLNWKLSMPDWDTGINDINDAILRYGKLYTLYTIINSVETSPLKTRLKAKHWFE